MLQIIHADRVGQDTAGRTGVIITRRNFNETFGNRTVYGHEEPITPV